MRTVRPVSVHVKSINVSMMICCQEAVSSGVKGQVEETHRLGLLSGADHRQHQTEEGERKARHSRQNTNKCCHLVVEIHKKNLLSQSDRTDSIA